LTGAYLIILIAISCGIMHLVALLKRGIKSRQGNTEMQPGPAGDLAPNIVGIVMIFIGLVFLFPFFLVLMTSFKDVSDLLMYPPTIMPRKPTLINYIDLFTNSFDGYPFSGLLVSMLAVPFLPALAVTLVSTVSAFGAAYYEYKGRRPLYALILASFMLLPTAMLPDYSNRLIYNNDMLLGFYAAFFSAAPLIGLAWFKSVIDRARQTGTGLFKAVLLNSIPVILVTYLMCYISPFANDLSLKQTGFTLYSSIVESSTVANRGIVTASWVIRSGIASLFLLAAFLTAVKFSPRKGREQDRI